MKQSAGRYRNLMTTLGALIHVARRNIIRFHPTTCSTLKSIGPSYFDESFGTGAFRTVPFWKKGDTLPINP
jgi:hypothetical protein